MQSVTTGRGWRTHSHGLPVICNPPYLTSFGNHWGTNGKEYWLSHFPLQKRHLVQCIPSLECMKEHMGERDFRWAVVEREKLLSLPSTLMARHCPSLSMLITCKVLHDNNNSKGHNMERKEQSRIHKHETERDGEQRGMMMGMETEGGYHQLAEEHFHHVDGRVELPHLNHSVTRCDHASSLIEERSMDKTSTTH